MKNLNLILILVLVVVAFNNFVSASPIPRSLTGSLVARSSLVERQKTCVCPDGTECESDNTCPSTCSPTADGPVCWAY